MRHEFVIEGDPVGKGRPRFTRQGRAYTPKGTREYEARVRKAYTDSGGPHFGDQEVAIVITAYFRMPKSWSKKKRRAMEGRFCTKKPDLTNIVKSVEDGLNGVAYDDDSQISVLIGQKYWADEGLAFVAVESVRGKKMVDFTTEKNGNANL